MTGEAGHGAGSEYVPEAIMGIRRQLEKRVEVRQAYRMLL